MHARALKLLQHHHDFAVIHKKGERRTKQVLVLTFLTMVVEITAGTLFGSMALLADGWHMGTHVAAFMITIIAYRYSRIHADDDTFAFSPGKVGVLGGFASSIALGVVALMMLIESAERLLKPRIILFDDAIAIAAFGLFINLICALLLKEHHSHHHDHDHAHGHHHHDQNLKAAYMHVLADALTSVLAIAALVSGKYYGWTWLDPVMGIVGGMIIIQWSYGLMKESSPVLMDESIDPGYKIAVKRKIESDADNRVSDLHIWRVGPKHYAIILSVVSHTPRPPQYYKALLKDFHRLSHITVEVNKCYGDECIIEE
ncbi:CDF family Co(II)/Ni(II) efflux transporter DmeF [Methylobacter sp. BlB1]|uniref:CDF family Co(II)/Ni(II) efflux transporter DmeF n=1 Tax=unclassified Methylobacter TaxID=2635283 RepID=UPI001893094C|nr:CDF family Co(II)/Ni(II) efflux transporter DmeF [Methylobacter sp. BlB1]MBF6651052.1 CDF family Co(II)/Ni(II) efflux transporter DmeF [Methylobacter sp. BlB1]